MLRLREAVSARHPSEILRGETGRFEVTAPSGDVYEVSCRAEGNPRIYHVNYREDYRGADQPWLVTKLSHTP